MLALALILASCSETASSVSMKDLNIYQPTLLKLQQGVTIQTEEGKYTPQTDEIWYSEKEFRELERTIYYK
jgi:hypothetical protein